MANRLRKKLSYGIDKKALTIAQEKDKIMKSLLTKKRIADARRKAVKIGLGHPVNRPKAVTGVAGRRGCGCSRGRR